MLIQFNASMFTNFNFTLVNETNVDIYVMPASDRDQDATFNVSTVNLTWYLQNYTDT